MTGNGTKYAQIADYYRLLIDSKKLREGDRLPSEAEISALFKASRITVRRAMEEIVQAGYIERIQGKGSFVRTLKRDMQLNHLKGFTEEMRAKGLNATSRVIDVSMIACEAKAAEHLKLDANSRVTSIKRLRFVNDEPVSFEHVFVPFHLYPELHHEDLRNSLYSLLARKGLKVHRASQSISAGFAPQEICELLNISKKAPTLNIERVTYLEDGTPLEYVLSTYRGDRYTFHVDMSR
ncbi:MAG: GntR family transcriptional regulator [Christensenellales bacterium]|jgi:GntR family transcriptional regulator